MISIFEVFAVNRNEEDFLENLFIFKELVNEENGQSLAGNSPPRNFEKEEEEKHPALKVLNQFKESMASEEYAWCKQIIIAQQQP